MKRDRNPSARLPRCARAGAWTSARPMDFGAGCLRNFSRTASRTFPLVDERHPPSAESRDRRWCTHWPRADQLRARVGQASQVRRRVLARPVRGAPGAGKEYAARMCKALQPVFPASRQFFCQRTKASREATRPRLVSGLWSRNVAARSRRTSLSSMSSIPETRHSKRISKWRSWLRCVYAARRSIASAADTE